MTVPVYLLKRLSDGLVALRYQGDEALWSRSTIRKTATCAVTGREIPKGAQAYRPVGNQQYRSARIAADVVDAIEESAETCGEYFGERDDTALGGTRGATCIRPKGHPPISQDGIGHSSTERGTT